MRENKNQETQRDEKQRDRRKQTGKNYRETEEKKEKQQARA